MYTRKIPLSGDALIGGAQWETLTGEAGTLLLPSGGGGLQLPQLLGEHPRYLVFEAEVLEDHSLTLNLQFLVKGEESPAFTIRFGLMPRVRARICVDLDWIDAKELFPGHTPGQLKVVCHGRRVHTEEIERVELVNYPCFHDVRLSLENLRLEDERPQETPLPDVKLIDELGQYIPKAWPEKVKDEAQLRQRLHEALELPDAYPFPTWDRYGGWAEKKLQEATGYFTKKKADGRWWLVDPLGNAFISVGPDCVAARGDCRVDGVEGLLTWLPDKDDPVYGEMYGQDRGFDKLGRKPKLFSFAQANLYRAFGEDWYAQWKKLIERQFKQHGMNTIGNWSDEGLFGAASLPYVTSLPEFPSTRRFIFRDFPDVLSEEYRESAQRCAKALEARREDPYMIGYFLRNEPSWAFVDNLVIADEVLYNPEPTACRAALIASLKAQYASIEALNAAWKTDFADFGALNGSIEGASKFSDAAQRDMREFSRRMLREYVTVPAQACRAVDPNHMILGMRWAWISDPDILSGWEQFDVFSINCYALDPTPALDNVVQHGVDLPILIGEFHHGALDGGLTATGLEGMRTQADRGMAYRYYAERVAAHPNGVGCHYFQCYDQFALGRFDGENYNIGLFDICSQPYGDMMKAVYACAEGLYPIADRKLSPTQTRPQSIPMIAY